MSNVSKKVFRDVEPEFEFEFDDYDMMVLKEDDEEVSDFYDTDEENFDEEVEYIEDLDRDAHYYEPEVDF